MKLLHLKRENSRRRRSFMRVSQKTVFFILTLLNMIRGLKSISARTHLWDYEEGEEDLFPDVSQEANNSVQFSY